MCFSAAAAILNAFVFGSSSAINIISLLSSTAYRRFIMSGPNPSRGGGGGHFVRRKIDFSKLKKGVDYVQIHQDGEWKNILMADIKKAGLALSTPATTLPGYA